MIDDDNVYFEVVGAGKIEISKFDGVQCGGKLGFSFGVEWGTHDYTGGVLSREEAIKLAEHILKYTDNINLRKHKLLNIEKSLS